MTSYHPPVNEEAGRRATGVRSACEGDFGQVGYTAQTSVIEKPIAGPVDSASHFSSALSIHANHLLIGAELGYGCFADDGLIAEDVAR